MGYDMVEFDRGQIWMVRFKNPEAVGREQLKDRPWLILSVGLFNQSSGMVTAVPITTRGMTKTPAQVLMTNLSGISNVILCEQIRTFDYKSGNYMFDYMGKVSDDILERVDVALSIHLGLHYSPISLKNLYDSMEAVIKSIGYLESKNNTPKFTDDDVSKFANSLIAKAKDMASRPVDTTYDNKNDIVEGSNDTTEDESEDGARVKPIRIKWTVELCNEFLHDSETLSMKEVMKKWNIQKKTRYYSMKNYAQTIVAKK